MKAKVCISGVHGVGKSRICKEIGLKLLYKTEKFQINDFNHSHKEFKYNNQLLEFCNTFILNEQFREVVKDLNLPKDITHFQQTEEITLATYAKQLYLENLYITQGKNILCDRSVLDTFVYYDYFEGFSFRNSDLCSKYIGSIHKYRKTSNYYDLGIATEYTKTYSKIYLIEPSDRLIEDDGFRLTSKIQQQEIHQLFLAYFKDFENVEIINQEDAFKEEFINKVVSEFII